MTAKEAYNNGVEVAINGQSVHANPFRNYEGLAEQYMAWEDGWHSQQ